ncbi:MAG TPA: GNAT family N-acetyltransferase [Magnetospirillum sp.]|nr:GNAT family N-acetyltransferase [Magnetospirillum sp.]
MIIRQAQAGDGATLHALLAELAAFEQGSVDATAADLERDAFGPRPLFEALLAEADGQPVGMLTFLTLYSSWRGRPALMIHDLFVRETARGLGAGKALVERLRAIAEQRGCCRVDVNVLDWNEKARGFYAALGFAHNDGWLGYRLPLR